MTKNFTKIMTNILILLTATFIVSCQGGNADLSAKGLPYKKQLEKINFAPEDTILMNIQDKIYQAFVQSIMSGDDSKLKEIENQLDKLYKKQQQNLILYWKSYLKYYSAILYLKKGDKEKSEEIIDVAVDIMEEMKNKNSEDYALLAMVQSFSIQFKGMKAMFISKRIKKNGNNAIKIDSTNMRGYFVLGSNDFYTPEKYGGGKKVEKYLLKAISLLSQKIKNPYLPSWGKEEAYELLIKHYIYKEKWEKAKHYFQEANNLYPNNYQINQLASKLVGK